MSLVSTVTIAGILANASMVGDGEDVTAVVRVNGEAVHSGSLKLADVKTALEIKVKKPPGYSVRTRIHANRHDHDQGDLYGRDLGQ